MEKFLVEVEHSPDKIDCLRTIQIFLSSGSHFLTHADWGCHDGVHKAWFTLEANSREEAMMIVPSFYREGTRITRLGKFNLEEVENLLKEHDGK
jgi:hypothetical protein